MDRIDAIIVTNVDEKEIAALVLAVQERRRTGQEKELAKNERKTLIGEYERRLEGLKSGVSPIEPRAVYVFKNGKLKIEKR